MERESACTGLHMATFSWRSEDNFWGSILPLRLAEAWSLVFTAELPHLCRWLVSFWSALLSPPPISPFLNAGITDAHSESIFLLGFGKWNSGHQSCVANASVCGTISLTQRFIS